MASFSIESTLGAVQIGFSVSCVVFGVLLSQAYAYFKNFPVDRSVYRILVSRLFSPENEFSERDCRLYHFCESFLNDFEQTCSFRRFV